MYRPSGSNSVFKRNCILQGVRPVALGFTILIPGAVIVPIQLLIFMMLVKIPKLFPQLYFILRGQGVEFFKSIQVVSSWLRCHDTTHSTKIHTRFQLRIVVDVSQCQAAFLYFFIIRQIQKSFSGYIKIQSNFLRGIMAICCFYFNGTSNSVVF
jgi:hypothetical protein